MIAISLTFPAGRYHATPWGRHVNEGAVEWPPSPWRLLRSLVAVWKRTLPDVPEAEIKPIFEKLAATLPRFVLPPASTGHTRHYMPILDGKKPTKTKVFDAFVAIDPIEAAVHAIWPEAKLENAQRDLLTKLLANLNFLGRTESWCEARLLSDEDADASLKRDGGVLRADPIDPAKPVERRHDLELVRTLCADPATVFGNDSFTDKPARTRAKKTATETIRTAAPYDPDWHLAAETLWLHDQKWSDPPGSRWITYTRPRTCFEVVGSSHPRPRPSHGRRADLPPDVQAPGPKFAAFKLVRADDGSELFARFPQHGAAHVAAMLRHAACVVAKRDLDPEIGRDEAWGSRVVAGHGMADKRRSKDDDSPRLSYLPLPSFEMRGRDNATAVGDIRRVIIAEFTGRDTADSIAWVRQRLSGELLIDERTGKAVAMLAPLSEGDYVLQQYTGGHARCEGSRVWSSVTPVILPGYDDGKPAKRERLLNACLRQAGLLAALESIVSQPSSWFPGVAPSSQFNDLNIRGSFKRRPNYLRHLPAVHVRLRFREPVRGPLSLGAGRHCGLGILAAAAE